MQPRFHPYLVFRDNAREALQFYQAVFGGRVILHTFQEYNASDDPNEDAKIINAVFETENGMTLMASDTPNNLEYQPGTNFRVAISGNNEEELSSYFEKLSIGGTLIMPLERLASGDAFGICTDRFGVTWAVNVVRLEPAVAPETPAENMPQDIPLAE